MLNGEKRLFFSPRDFLRNEGRLRPDRAANVVGDVVTSDDYCRRPTCGVAHTPFGPCAIVERTKPMMTATTMEPAAVEEVDRRADRAMQHGSTSNRRANRGFGKLATEAVFPRGALIERCIFFFLTACALLADFNPPRAEANSEMRRRGL